MSAPPVQRQAGSMATGPKAVNHPTPQAQPLSIRDRFDRLANRVTTLVGSPIAVFLAVVVVLVWLVSGPIFNFSDTWQLVINTSTTIVTFWMVFLIQASANRDNRALHLKLDEVIRAMGKARNEFITAEQATEAEFEVRETELRAIAEDDGSGPNGPVSRPNGRVSHPAVQGRSPTDDMSRSAHRPTPRAGTQRHPVPSGRPPTGRPSTDSGE